MRAEAGRPFNRALPHICVKRGIEVLSCARGGAREQRPPAADMKSWFPDIYLTTALLGASDEVAA
jgi:hypothetical protein